jgi:hypothetical protein
VISSGTENVEDSLTGSAQGNFVNTSCGHIAARGKLSARGTGRGLNQSLTYSSRQKLNKIFNIHKS